MIIYLNTWGFLKWNIPSRHHGCFNTKSWSRLGCAFVALMLHMSHYSVTSTESGHHTLPGLVN